MTLKECRKYLDENASGPANTCIRHFITTGELTSGVMKEIRLTCAALSQYPYLPDIKYSIKDIKINIKRLCEIHDFIYKMRNMLPIMMDNG